MDPFFKAKHKKNGPPWGQHESYIEDLYRSFGKSKLPERDYERFNRAYQFRQKELEDASRLQREHESERQWYEASLTESTTHIRKLTAALRGVTEQYSKLKLESDGWRSNQSTTDSTGGGGSSSVHAEGGSLPRPVDEPAVPDGVRSDVESDPRGQGDKHDSEGRHVGRADADGGVQLREEPVPEGGAN